MSMYPKNMFFTSESVTEGHPDKFCDQISDAVLDECLKHDPMSRVACETYVTMGMLIVGGEVTTEALFDVSKVVREVGNEIGSTSPKCGSMAAGTVKQFGAIDILVNNDGIEGTPCLTKDLSEEQWDRVLGVNLKGVCLPVGRGGKEGFGFGCYAMRYAIFLKGVQS